MRKLDAPYIGIQRVEVENDITLLINKSGDSSVIIKCENPVVAYSANVEEYYDFHHLFSNIIKILGEKYTLQKQDIFVQKKFDENTSFPNDFLDREYFNHFKNRLFTDIETYIIITYENSKGTFFTYDEKLYEDFLKKILKVKELLSSKRIESKILDEIEIKQYLMRFFACDFDSDLISLNNFKVSDEYISINNKKVKSLSIVDIDEVDFPYKIQPFKNINIGFQFPTDLFSFLFNVPNCDVVIYEQVISIPEQKSELNKLELKRKRHSSMPDPANLLCVEDIDAVKENIARDNQLLVYTHYNIILSSEESLSKGINFIESSLFDIGIVLSKQSYNQFELFMCSLPGCAVFLKNYDKFLTTSDAALCLLAKDNRQKSEDSPFLVRFTDRAGVPVAIDISGKEGKIKRTVNSNRFVLGPSGSGKSFFMNSLLRQMYLQDTDIVLIDTGHSYSGLCNYYNGKYITYSEENPISMNPFLISESEYNIEKKNFLKSLIIVIWKGTNGKANKEEEEIIDRIIDKYYSYYFNPFTKFTEEEKENLKNELLLEYQTSEDVFSQIRFQESEKLREKFQKIKLLAVGGIDGEKENAQRILDKITEENEELKDDSEDSLLIKHIDKIIEEREEVYKSIKVTELSFNSFFEFSILMIPLMCRDAKIKFDIRSYKFILSKFYKGGQLERTLNETMDVSLFDEKFIVFEIDAIKDDPVLFPIVTLIIMDIYIQKMRLKKNRKSLIIEEAWKAIASEMMSGFILYLYKTARKFWGDITTVTQELEDIISNKIVKNSIINNSETIILLDQAKFKDNFQEIGNVLALTEIEQKKIFTINNLDNKDNRSFFKEVYIKRGSVGEVYGVEVSLSEYLTFTTERVEKDAISCYLSIYGDFQTSIEEFIKDMQSSELSLNQWVIKVNKVFNKTPLDEIIRNKKDLKNYILQFKL